MDGLFYWEGASMWSLETPWSELVLRAVIVFVFCFIVLRIWGRKHLTELSPFDFLLLLILAESVESSLMGEEKSVVGGMLTFGTLVLLNTLLNKVSFRFKKVEKIVEGEPDVLIKDGKVDEALLKKIQITQQELHEALREQGVLSVDEVKRGTLETNGKISIIKKEEGKPLKRTFH